MPKTLLQVASLIYLFGCITYTIIGWETLSKGEGWGVVGMVGLMGLGVLSLIIDFLLKLFIKDQQMLNWIGLGVIIIFLLLMTFGG